jgi:glycosyltransferase involved in cell wall biosynthesis
VRILYLAPDSLSARKGAAVRIGLTVATLRELGHEVDVLTADAVTGDEPVPEDPLARWLSWRRRAAAWLATREADLVQFRGIWEGVPAVAWARQRGVPAVFEAHGFPSVELPHHFADLSAHGDVMGKLVRDERHVLERARRVLTHSRTGALYLERLGVPVERIAVVPNAVDTDVFRPGPAPPDEKPLRVVYTGTLAPWQGLASLLEALHLLRGAPAVELQIVGPARGPWRAHLRGLARRLRVHHAVRFSPAMDRLDLLPLLQTAHACVAPLPADARNTLQGCCPIKVLEYMACGRPVLATAIGPVHELVEHGRTAHLVRPGSATALADGLAWMATHPVERESLGAAAREEAVARFTPRHFRERLQAALTVV